MSLCGEGKVALNPSLMDYLSSGPYRIGFCLRRGTDPIVDMNGLDV
jgi:hypothetical protein